jgi:chromosome segregation ATPase
MRSATDGARTASQADFARTSQSAFGATAKGDAAGSASLKGKLLSLEEMIRALTEEMNFHKKEVQILRSEKDTLENVLNMKTQDVRKSLMNEIYRVEEEMKRHFAHQKAENNRLQQQINQLKGEKTALQQQLLALQRRISELELQVGQDES